MSQENVENVWPGWQAMVTRKEDATQSGGRVRSCPWFLKPNTAKRDTAQPMSRPCAPPRPAPASATAKPVVELSRRPATPGN